MNCNLEQFGMDYDYQAIGGTMAVHADCLEWMGRITPESIHAIVTDPPYGVKEYDFDQLEKRANGNGGVWRLPPVLDGHQRSPLPRFTALNPSERERLKRFFEEWGRLALSVLKPGGHIFIATNTFLSQMVYESLVAAGLEFRGEIIRIVKTLRGGDRPKNAEREFPEVCSLPRGCFEPWGLFRRPTALKVSDCLREYGTGGLRRLPDGPFCDLIKSEITPREERNIASHPSLKPQSFMRHIVYAALPLGEGIILDPFMGHGSTLAAAESMGLNAIGVERYADYYHDAAETISRLAEIRVRQQFRIIHDTLFSIQ
ncbi:MAG: site-specific DNA-methyltransferase [Phycisphaerae bacterium]|nr:site-specific DNA-methyltransferase [Phycisphaerae bacterium]